MKRYDLIVVGAGPAGLSAAIEAAKCGLSVAVFDENAKPGGQLFKQIHKFFGSKEHQAKIRGYKIGETLLSEADAAGVEVYLNATVSGMYMDKEILVRIGAAMEHFKADAIIIATGASENMVTFDGWTLPGVIGAGAAQTMMNLYGIQPGKRVLMLGSGNVGLVVSFQLMQAGCEVVALVDAAPRIGGYGVHASKIARCGVPFYLSHTITKAEGTDCVTGVEISQVDDHFTTIPGTQKHFDVDTICMAVGLSPMSQLLKMAGCNMVDDPRRGGQVPLVDENGETSISGVFAAGDVSGIEEASSAMIEGRMSGLSAAAYLGFLSEKDKDSSLNELEVALDSLHQGMFAPGSKGKAFTKTDEGIAVSQSLLKKGYLDEADIARFNHFGKKTGVHPVIECTQNIPCNPCQDACPKQCIKIGKTITAIPRIDEDNTCTGCGLCIASCSGQAIFLVDEDYEPGYASITLPYEFLPRPQKGDLGTALSRSGQPLGVAEIIDVRSAKAFDHTTLVTIKVPVAQAMTARFYKREAQRAE
ncbi:FAD-dependent oxidoreductase [Acetobacterium tundrae]|uniref:FAD-binding protein n=1 Tax=Acetobacterium tundrae TaxID=132932 RepID=A0ABR6WJC1_9FIRM|nr:FAD-dependent oxidoreductase [Acetobacterium tundrae]MBC3796593.1 FAD-binding protein [Acetobacterium tundrae]